MIDEKNLTFWKQHKPLFKCYLPQIREDATDPFPIQLLSYASHLLLMSYLKMSKASETF